MNIFWLTMARCPTRFYWYTHSLFFIIIVETSFSIQKNISFHWTDDWLVVSAMVSQLSLRVWPYWHYCGCIVSWMIHWWRLHRFRRATNIIISYLSILIISERKEKYSPSFFEWIVFDWCSLSNEQPNSSQVTQKKYYSAPQSSWCCIGHHWFCCDCVNAPKKKYIEDVEFWQSNDT